MPNVGIVFKCLAIKKLVGQGIVQNHENTSKVDRSIKLGKYIAYKVLIKKNLLAQKKIQNGRQKSKMAARKNVFSSLSSKPSTFLNNIKKQLTPRGHFISGGNISAM